MTIQEATDRITKFMKMSRDEVFQHFVAVPGAQLRGVDQKRFLYIPAKRENAVLLVGHADTVWSDDPVELKIETIKDEVIISSARKDRGIGADDRSGIAMIDALLELGHGVMICDGEERGCIGANYTKTHPSWNDTINRHQFLIEFDRRGNDDLIFYSVGSNEFVKWCEANFTGFTAGHGSFTDICVLCEETCGVNISIGYYSQHSSNETQNVNEWIKTYNTTREVLSKQDIPKFHLDQSNVYKPTYTTRSSNYFSIDRTRSTYDGFGLIDESLILASLCACKSCGALMDKSELVFEDYCPICGNIYNQLEEPKNAH